MLNLFRKPIDGVDIRNTKIVKQLYSQTGLTYPPTRHNLGWSTKKKHLDFLYNFARKMKPGTIIETGTFEGHGTFAMAAAASENNNDAVIYTIDYDGDPAQDEKDTVSEHEWSELSRIRQENIERISREFKNCQVIFIEGDSRLVLPQVVAGIETWDFWYQDSMHFAQGIREEWNIMCPYASKGAVVIFDDIWKRNEFSRWFLKEYKKQWLYVPRRDYGHKQCLAQRL